MPLPSFNMEDILNPNFQTFPVITCTTGCREVAYGNSPKHRIFNSLNLYESSSTLTENIGGVVRHSGNSGTIDKQAKRKCDTKDPGTCKYPVIRRTSDLTCRKSPSNGNNRLRNPSTASSGSASSPMEVITRCAKSAQLPQRSSPTRRRLRTVFNDRQLSALEDRFACQKYLSTPDRDTVAKGLGLTQMQVKTWYQNRRMRWKKAILAGECSDDLTDGLRKGKGRPKDISRLSVCGNSVSGSSSKSDLDQLDEPMNLAKNDPSHSSLNASHII